MKADYNYKFIYCFTNALPLNLQLIAIMFLRRLFILYNGFLFYIISKKSVVFSSDLVSMTQFFINEIVFDKYFKIN